MKPTIKLFQTIAFMLFLGLFGIACSSDKGDGGEQKESKGGIKKIEVDPMQNKGIGPISSVTLGETVDEAMAAEGMKIYDEKCTACHKPNEKHIGPSPQGILTRRSPEWIMNMILNPDEMVQKDDVAKALLMEYNGSPMANQNLTEAEARAVLEYFRTL
jgi:mono/diheme cytochrome c family protein